MICASIRARDTKEALDQMELAFGVAHLVELRLDLMEEWDLKLLLSGKKGPVVVTARSSREGGGFRGSEEKRIQLLGEAVEMGADFVDVELSTQGRLLETLRDQIRRKGNSTRLILSWHNWKDTPSTRTLRSVVLRCLWAGAAIAKVVTTASRPQHNLAALELLCWAKAHGIPTICFCMGELGRPSRVMAPLWGAPFTYGCLGPGKEVAPGQMGVAELRMALEILGGECGEKD